MIYVFYVLHFLVTVLLIAGIMVTTTKSEGLGGTIGGGSDTVFRGASSKGFEAFIERGMVYMAWTFLGMAFLSAVLLPKFML